MDAQLRTLVQQTPREARRQSPRPCTHGSAMPEPRKPIVPPQTVQALLHIIGSWHSRPACAMHHRPAPRVGGVPMPSGSTAGGELALLVARCPSCRRADPDGTRVEKGRQVKYGTDPGGRSSGSYGEHQAV
jgi:hypothetical protein